MAPNFASDRRLSIIGFIQQQICFVDGKRDGGVNRKCYIHMIKQEAVDVEKTGRTRVIFQDNGSIHQCREVQKLWSKLDSMGLYIFFLPKYGFPMNRIELEWQHLKKYELSSQTFED